MTPLLIRPSHLFQVSFLSNATFCLQSAASVKSDLRWVLISFSERVCCVSRGGRSFVLLDHPEEESGEFWEVMTSVL